MAQRQDEIIRQYEAILACIRNMLDLAGKQSWEDLITYEQAYLEAVDRVEQLERDVQLDEHHESAKRDLLVVIRDTEDRLSDKLRSRLGELTDTIAWSRNQVRVQQAYESGTAGN